MKKCRGCLPLLVVALAAGCASSDGGPVGTGISTTSAISGNVVAVQNATAPSPLPTVQVSIDGLSTVHTTTDSNGNFELSGNFAGPITLRFTAPQFQATEQLDVPAGSAVVLQDIDLQPGSVDAQAERQLGFFGTVDMVDCTDGTLLVSDRRRNGAQFLVHLGADTSIADAAGQAASCAAIATGASVVVAGTIQADRTIAALTVTIGESPPPQSQPIRSVAFTGAIADVDCGADLIVVDDSVQRTRVQLTAQTVITAAAGATLGCGDLRLGDTVQGRGQLNLRMPGIVVATQLTVGAGAPGQELRLFGIVSGIDCGRGTLQVNDLMNPLAVQLSPATSIVARGGQQPLSCSDIVVGDRVTGTGQTSATDPNVIDALQLVVSHSGGGPASQANRSSHGFLVPGL